MTSGQSGTAVHYSHTQTGWWMLATLGVGGAGLLAAIATVSDRRHTTTATSAAFGLGVGLAILLLCAALFSTLNVRVTSDAVRWRFGPGLIRFAVPLAEISAVVPTRTSFWAGIGIHWIGSGWVYNVSGRDAVELTRRDGRKIWIGTDQPAALSAAIESARTPRH